MKLMRSTTTTAKNRTETMRRKASYLLRGINVRVNPCNCLYWILFYSINGRAIQQLAFVNIPFAVE